jgi:hypothetical protein
MRFEVGNLVAMGTKEKRIVGKSEGPHWPCRKLIYMESPPPLMEVCGLKPELL